MAHLWIVEVKDSQKAWVPALFFFSILHNSRIACTYLTRHGARLAVKAMQLTNRHRNPFKFIAQYRVRKYTRCSNPDSHALVDDFLDQWLPPHLRTRR